MIGTFGAETVRVPRARLAREDGGTAEWRSKALRRYQRLTQRAEAAEALIAGAHLEGDGHLAAGGDGRAPGWPEGSAGAQE